MLRAYMCRCKRNDGVKMNARTHQNRDAPDGGVVDGAEVVAVDPEDDGGVDQGRAVLFRVVSMVGLAVRQVVHRNAAL